tara:strand:+ start:12 stop:1229 length:1218 start_codon:yes stop_codon:yes gene_type:complete
MNIQNIKTQDIKPYLENPRQNKNAINVVKKSLQEFGFQQPLVLDKDNIVVAGHTRLEAAKQLNIKEVPCIIADNLSEERIKAYRIMDNKSAEYASWDLQLLTQELNDLIKMDFDLELTGFSDDELDDLGLHYNLDEFVEEGLSDEDEIPELEEDSISKDGDLWILGSHRLLCGDATSFDAVDKLMNNKKADMIFTDPPYGVDYVGVNNDSRDGLEELLRNVFANYITVSRSGASCYVFHSDRCADIFHRVFREFFHFSSMIIWFKNTLTLSQTDYQSQHEPCMYGWNKNGTHKFYGDRKQISVWQNSKEKFSGHTTNKPVNFIIQALKNSSLEAHIVLDLFGGSGSTLIAGEATARKCYMMELDPKYVDVIVKRWQNYTGKDAYLESSEEKFDQLQKIQKNTSDG